VKVLRCIIIITSPSPAAYVEAVRVTRCRCRALDAGERAKNGCSGQRE